MPVTHAKSVTVADWAGVVTVNNSTGGTVTANGSDLARPTDWNSAHVVNLSASEVAGLFNFARGLSSSTAAGGISVGVGTDAWFEPFPLHNTNSTLSAPGIGTWYLDGPYELDQALPKGQINMLVSNAAGFSIGGAYSAATTGAWTRNQTMYNQLAIYTQGSGASTSRLESLWTGQVSIVAEWRHAMGTANTSSGTISNGLSLTFGSQWDTAGAATYGTTGSSGTTAFGTSTVASTYASGLVSAAAAFVTGARMDIIGFTTTLPPGVYWLAHMFTSTSSSNGTTGGLNNSPVFISTQSRLGLLENNIVAYKRLGLSVSNSSTNVQPFHGFLATTTSNATSIINTSDMRGTTGRMYFNFFQSTY